MSCESPDPRFLRGDQCSPTAREKATAGRVTGRPGSSGTCPWCPKPSGRLPWLSLSSCVPPLPSQCRRTAQPLGIGAQNLDPHLPRAPNTCWGLPAARRRFPLLLCPEREVAGLSNWAEEGSWRRERPAWTQPSEPRRQGLAGGPPLSADGAHLPPLPRTDQRRDTRAPPHASCRRAQRELASGTRGLSADTWHCPFREGGRPAVQSGRMPQEGRGERPAVPGLQPRAALQLRHRHPLGVMKMAGVLFPVQPMCPRD